MTVCVLASVIIDDASVVKNSVKPRCPVPDVVLQ